MLYLSCKIEITEGKMGVRKEEKREKEERRKEKK